jgi:hypothetical protein
MDYNNSAKEIPEIVTVDDIPHLTKPRTEVFASLILGAVIGTCVTAYLFITNGAI